MRTEYQYCVEFDIILPDGKPERIYMMTVAIDDDDALDQALSHAYKINPDVDPTNLIINRESAISKGAQS